MPADVAQMENAIEQKSVNVNQVLMEASANINNKNLRV